MKSHDLILGELREFKRASLERFDKIEKHVESFQIFRWKVIGAASLAAFLATTMIELWKTHHS